MKSFISNMSQPFAHYQKQARPIKRTMASPIETKKIGKTPVQEGNPKHVVANKRILLELKDWDKYIDKGIMYRSADDDHIKEWHASIQGPKGSPYEGGEFFVEIKFSNNYPFEAPEVRFLTPVYHPNIGSNEEA